MNAGKLKSTIIYVEVIGFAFILALNWGLELFDLLPFFVGGDPTPVNWPEAGIETAGIMVMAVVVIGWSKRSLSRIRHLEGLLHICSFCKRIETKGRWIHVDDYVRERNETLVSHGICTECLAKHYPELTVLPPGDPNQM